MTADPLSRQLRTLPAFRALLRAVEAGFYADLELGQPLLDLGCGDGHFASEAFHEPFAAGVDPWLQPLHEARAEHATFYHTLAQADGARLPFASNSFAGAVSNSVLEHIPHLDDVLRDLARVLRPRARFAFSVPSENFPRFLSIARALRRVHFDSGARVYEKFFNWISRHHHCDSPAVWRERLAQAGFQIERFWYYFSPGALAALEWGHYFGAPAMIARWLTGRWVLAANGGNLWLTDKIMRRYYVEELPAAGAYLFFVTRRVS